MKGQRQWLLGGIIISVGLLMLLNNLGITAISIKTIFREFWPVILIAWGLTMLWGRKDWGQIITGLIIIGVGTVILGNKQGWFMLNLSYLWSVFWPLILILIGLSFLLGQKVAGKSHWAFMGGFERKKEWSLENGNYWAIMGGITLDLHKAQLEQGKAYKLSCTALMGGIEIMIPKHITVYCEGTAILGGVELLGEESGGIFTSLKAERIGEAADNPVVYISCRAVMGGIEIK